jgi:hypothetical protein
LQQNPSFSSFHCDKCHRVWEIGAGGFQEASGALVQPLNDLPNLSYYPFWILSTNNVHDSLKKLPQKELNLFIPAFKARNLTAIYKLAIAFTNAQPELNPVSFSDNLPFPKMEGAVMRQNDAQELAELVLFSLAPHSHYEAVKDIKPAPLEITSRQLVWLPFYESGLYIRDALLNIGILKGKINSPKLSRT